MDWCTSYLMILLWGIVGLAYYNILCGILRGLGDSLSALVYLLVATVLNIILDPAAIKVPCFAPCFTLSCCFAPTFCPA
mgnify:CR=1 FL=1